jgi:hypothetical protein
MFILNKKEIGKIGITNVIEKVIWWCKSNGFYRTRVNVSSVSKSDRAIEVIF